MDYKTLRKRALISDAVCIVIAAAVLYAGSNFQLPPWLPILGLLVALAALIVSLRYSRQYRKLERAALEQRARQADSLPRQQASETHSESETHQEKEVKDA